jgi:hypothetical protein
LEEVEMDKHKPPIPRRICLVRDLLDNRLIDRYEEPMGRVDRVVLEIPPNGPPRVVGFETGVPALADRLSTRLGRGVRAIGSRFGLRRGRPVRIAWAKVRCVDIDLQLDANADFSQATIWERWLRKHITSHIPAMKRS